MKIRFKREKKMITVRNELTEEQVILRQNEIKLIKLMGKLTNNQLGQIICNLI